MDGYRGRDYFTKDEFNSGCSFNYWYGAFWGVTCILAIEFVFAWVKGII